MKKYILSIFLLLFSFVLSCSKEYDVRQLKIKELNHSKYADIFNDIRYVDGNLFIFCHNNEKDYGGYLNKIIEVNNKYKLIDEYAFDKKFRYDTRYAIRKCYYISDNGTIVTKKDIDGYKSEVEEFNKMGKSLQKFITETHIADEYYYLDKDILYYDGRGIKIPLNTEFYIQPKSSIIKKGMGRYLNIVGSTDKYFYSFAGDCRKLFIDEKVEGKTKKILQFKNFFYRSSNLMYYSRDKKKGALTKNNIIYQIRFFNNSEKEKDNDNSRVSSKVKTIQTLIIGVDIEKEKLVREIKINYPERKVSEAPNSFDVDEKGNIYILDSAKKNIIKIDKKVKELEINYKY